MRTPDVRTGLYLTSNTVQRRVTSTRREMYRQLPPAALPVPAFLIARRDDRLARLGPGCVYCGGTSTGMDHIEPLVLNGMPTGLVPTVLDMVPCCASCNSSKGSSSWRDYMRRIAVKRSHAKRVKWLSAYDRWRRRHAQRWPVEEHADTIMRLNCLVNDAHAFMQAAVNRAARHMHGARGVLARSRDLELDWSSLDQQLSEI